MTPNGLAALELARALAGARPERTDRKPAPPNDSASVQEEGTPMRAAAGTARGLSATARHVPGGNATDLTSVSVAERRNGHPGASAIAVRAQSAAVTSSEQGSAWGRAAAILIQRFAGKRYDVTATARPAAVVSPVPSSSHDRAGACAGVPRPVRSGSLPPRAEPSTG